MVIINSKDYFSVYRSLDREGATWIPVEEGCHYPEILDFEQIPVMEWNFQLTHEKGDDCCIVERRTHSHL